MVTPAMPPAFIARSTIETMERETGDRVGGDEVQEMQRAMEAWQAHATEAQQVRFSRLDVALLAEGLACS